MESLKTGTANILNRIVAKKKEDYGESWQAFDPANYNPKRKPISIPLAAPLQYDKFLLIAECKKASPSKGVFAKNYAPQEIAKLYTKWGASAISVLCEERFFLGSLAHLQAVRKVTPLPLLIKDFIVDEKQIADGLESGGDIVLLIAKLLSPSRLQRLLSFAQHCGLATLIEIYDEHDAQIVSQVLAHQTAIQAKAPASKLPDILLGINNRDLRTFAVDHKHSLQLKKLLPSGYIVISESGISSKDDIETVKSHGFNGALVGEVLMKHVETGKSAKDFFQRN